MINVYQKVGKICKNRFRGTQREKSLLNNVVEHMLFATRKIFSAVCRFSLLGFDLQWSIFSNLYILILKKYFSYQFLTTYQLLSAMFCSRLLHVRILQTVRLKQSVILMHEMLKNIAIGHSKSNGFM